MDLLESPRRFLNIMYLIHHKFLFKEKSCKHTNKLCAIRANKIHYHFEAMWEAQWSTVPFGKKKVGSPQPLGGILTFSSWREELSARDQRLLISELLKYLPVQTTICPRRREKLQHRKEKQKWARKRIFTRDML